MGTEERSVPREVRSEVFRGSQMGQGAEALMGGEWLTRCGRPCGDDLRGADCVCAVGKRVSDHEPRRREE